MNANNHPNVDIAILGGGIAGLWLLNRLHSAGHNCVLIEKNQLGSGQTLASQGMIHGGIKYTLGGNLTAASETIASMPERWRRCLSGQGEVDLRETRLLSEDYFLFSDGRLTSRLTAFFGSKAVEGRVDPVADLQLPDAFQHPDFKGSVYRLQDVVIDTPSLVANLAELASGHLIEGDYSVTRTDYGFSLTNKSRTNHSQSNLSDTIHAKHLILAAGEGNGPLIESLDLPVSMQRRPLNQIVIKGDNLPALYAHAVSLRAGDKPRVTITTHNGNWYLGGQLAETGVNRSDEAQCHYARREITALFPWIDFSQCTFETLRINRAEAGQSEGQRPDTPFVKTCGNVTVCFPTKLTLTPLLGDWVVSEMDTADASRNISSWSRPDSLAAPDIGRYPWEAS